MASIRLQELQSELQDVEGFTDPKIQLEQYVTTPHLAACVLHTVYDDLEDKLVADLGCGCGILAIGATIMQCSGCIGLDIDGSALEICRGNLTEFDMEERVDLINMDVTKLHEDERWRNRVDTVVMNPPFGTKNNQGIDMLFLKSALHIASGAVISLHKTATRQHVEKVTRGWGYHMSVVAELRYDLPATMRRHKHQTIDIEVDCLRFTPATAETKPREAELTWMEEKVGGAKGGARGGARGRGRGNKGRRGRTK